MYINKIGNFYSPKTILSNKISSPIHFGIGKAQDKAITDTFESTRINDGEEEKYNEIEYMIGIAETQAKNMTYRKSRAVIKKGKHLLKKGKKVNFEDLKATSGIGKNSLKVIYGEIDEYTGLPKSVATVRDNNPDKIFEKWEFTRTPGFKIPYVIYTRFIDDVVVEDKIFEESGYDFRRINTNIGSNPTTDTFDVSYSMGTTYTKSKIADGEEKPLFKLNTQDKTYREYNEDGSETLYEKVNENWTKRRIDPCE